MMAASHRGHPEEDRQQPRSCLAGQAGALEKTTREGAQMPRTENPTRLAQSGNPLGRPGAGTQRAALGILAAILSLSILVIGVEATAAAPTARQSVAKKKPKGFTVKATSGTMTLTLSAQTWTRINSSLGSTVGTTTTAIAPAAANPTGTLTFPITHGSLNSVSGHGTVNAQGGLTIESHLSVAGFFNSSSSVTANSPVASLGTTSKVTMTSENFKPPSVALLTLNLSRIKVLGSRHAVSLSKIPASLTALGVAFFGSSFHTGEKIGTVSIQIKG
jgi:hypothetical protein